MINHVLAVMGIAFATMLGTPAWAAGSGDDDVKPMAAAQLAQYKSERAAAKAQWDAMTPQQRAATVASAKQKRLADLSAIERYGQNDDMLQETAKQSAQLKAQYEANRASYQKLTAQQREALRQAAWKKKRADLSGMELVGQRNDTDPEVIQ